ncbi:alpha-L-rhamnosidase [Draconibacterium sediminis]|uniref:alpha-L-rhamnosidase n=1 Tax=Draconibacterium sediminis TaxID=1544798 RepID=UPI00069797A4|nr:alpha-L-rhamnosidase [Draconibacterium sediminis]
MHTRFISNNKPKVFGISCILITLLLFCACKEAPFGINELKAEFISNIDTNPIFSWKTGSLNPGFQQSAVQLIIADNQTDINKNVGNVWDSDKVKTGTSNQLKYGGNKLKNGELYWAKLKVWDEKDRAANWSEAVSFFVPINYPNHWKAEWITYDYKPDVALPVFKKVLAIPNKQEIEWARLYIAAPGFYEAYLNGEKIGENVLDPGQTNYEDYTYYSAYNLDLSDKGHSDVLGVMLGNGWYNQNVVWGKGMIYGQPVFMAQIVVTFKDETKEVIGTDESWIWKNGPITFSNIYAGESYDANLEVEDWFNTETSDKFWKKALFADQHPTNLLEQFAPPIQKMDSIQPQKIITNDSDRYIFDFGQNFAGWVKLKIKGEKGQEIVLRCVEELDENGEIDPRTTGMRATKVIQTQKYICKGEGTETWEPKFTYFGFRYVEVEGLAEKPTPELLTGVVVHSALPKSGEFNCSEENINKLHQLAEWTIKSNLHSIPTDCPHREKCGWTGDAHSFIDALMYNYDAQQFMSKYVFDMRSSARNTNQELYFGNNFHDRSLIQKPKGIPTMIVPGKRTSGTASPDWGTAVAQVPWNLYKYYGDTLVLRNFYPDMKVWVDYVQNKNKNGIIFHGLGDWCPPGGNENIECPVSLSSTAFHILDLKILAQTAHILGNETDFNYYRNLKIQSTESFNKHFLDTVNYTYGSQTADAMALDIGIVPEALKEKVAESLVENIHDKHDGFISTGIFGISRILNVLAENGFEDEVYRLLTKKGENSFAYMWEHYNATTLWEILPVYTLVGDEMAFRSHNHPMQSGYDAWFYSGIAGINPVDDEPGFKKIVFRPYLTQKLSNANASYESVYGTIKSSWKNANGKFIWEIKVPENSFGEFFIPNYKKEVNVLVNGNPVKCENCSFDFTFIGEFGSGSYLIEMKRD